MHDSCTRTEGEVHFHGCLISGFIILSVQAQGGGIQHQGTGDFVQSFWLQGVSWRVAPIIPSRQFSGGEMCQVGRDKL